MQQQSIDTTRPAEIELQCPKCLIQSQAQSSASVQFYVSVRCDHCICNKCLDKLYPQRSQQQPSTAGSGSEPSQKCQTTNCLILLSRKDFQKHESLETFVKRETDCRRRVKNIYNKARQDFDTDDQYDDYLEQIEDKVFKLSSKETSPEERQALRNQIKADERALQQ